MKKKFTFIAIFLSLVLGLNAITFAFADEEPASEEPEPSAVPGAVLELTPVNRRMALDLGETREDAITIKNVSDEKVSLSVYVTPFSNGDGGETQDFETETKYTQISRWMKVKDEGGEYMDKVELSLGPKESRKIGYIINVPESAPSGGQYASVVSELAPAEGGNETDIKTISRVGMVLFATIAGETNRSAQITDIEAQVAAINNNIGVKFTVKNSGNIDFQASAEIAVSSIFGKELYRNSSLVSVLPENSKTVVAEWGETPGFGLYRLDYNINALDINATGHQYVLVMSPLLLAAFIIVIIGAAVSIFYLVKKHTIDKDKNITIG